MKIVARKPLFWASLPLGAALLLVLAWVVLISPIQAVAAPPTTPIIDGVIHADGTDWDADELVVDDPLTDSAWGSGNELDNLYVTWDEDNLYVGVSYTVNTNAMIVYVDLGTSGGETDFNSGRGWTGAYPRNITVTAETDIDLMLARWDHNAPQAYTVVDNASTDISSSANVSYTTDMVEYAIPWSVVGRPYSDTICLVTILAGGDNWGAADSMPDNASTNGDGGPDGLTNLYCFGYAPYQDELVINELDADTPGVDAAEFIEIYDGGHGNSALDGLVLVFYNGSGDVSYYAIDLDSYTTDANGYFVAGNAAVPGVDVTFAGNLLQNGQDAVALYWGDAADFPNNTPVTTANLVDAIVYDTDDADDPGLLALLNSGQPQVNENENGGSSKDVESNQRCPNGSGGQRNTDTYMQRTPTPDGANNCLPDLTVSKTGAALTSPGATITYTITYANIGDDIAHATILTDTLPVGVSYVGDNSGLLCPACTVGATGELTWTVGTVPPVANVSFVLTGVVSSSISYGEALTNTVAIATADAESSTANNSDSWMTSISSLDLTVQKSGPAVLFGGDLEYEIVVKNVGVVAASQVIVTDTLPVSTTFVAQSSSALTVTVTGGQVAWEFGDVPSNTAETIALTLTVDAGVANGMVLDNAVEATTATPGDNPANNSDQATTTYYARVPIATARAGSVGQVFAIEGQVTVVPGTYNPNNREWTIQDSSGGIAIYHNSGSGPLVNLGDTVRVVGTFDTFNGQEQLEDPLYLEIVGSGPEVDPTPYATGAVPSGASEGWLVGLHGFASGLNCPGDGQFDLDDGSGAATIYIDFDTGVDVCAMGAVNGSYMEVIGFSTQFNALYEVKPRRPDDVAVIGVEKEAPSLVSPGELYTYTITIGNRIGYTLTDVVITDVVPISATFAYALDGGAFDGTTVQWDVPDLGDLEVVTVRFAVTATTQNLTMLVNDHYAVTASNFLTPTFGAPVYTFVSSGPPRIHDIQGARHFSIWNGQLVEDIYGIVTVVHGDGFYLQDPTPDGNAATSEGIFVYEPSPGVAVGDEVEVDGEVEEYYPGGSGSGNLSTTELDASAIAILSSGNPLPPPTVIGNGGRVPPGQVIEDDVVGDVNQAGESEFDPDEDGLDFYESLEGMYVLINDALAVAPTNSFGEIAVVGDDGANAGVMTPRGGIVIQSGDFNPERIFLDDELVGTPNVAIGASFTSPVVGVMDYSFGNFKLLITQALTFEDGAVISETTALTRTADQLTVATFNLLNIDPTDPQDKFDALAVEIVTGLDAPDIIAVEEVQDNNGAVDDGTVAANLTFGKLIQAIQNAGGPVYEYRQIDPENNRDGGEPGGNIRVGFLYRADRGLEFVDRPGAGAATPITATLGTDGIELSYSPGRIDPTNDAFLDSRKPLAGEFSFNGQKLIVIANHLNSKGGDQPLFGRYQPPTLVSEIQRLAQATVLNGFVQHVLSLDPEANVIVLGDLNDFQFSAPIVALAGAELHILDELLPVEERYTYLYDGNSQALDHILASNHLFGSAGLAYDVVHMNAEFPKNIAPTDHDPALARFTLTEAPAELSIVKTVAYTNPADLGDVVTYTILLDHAGATPVLGVVMTDVLPTEVAFGGWVQANGAVSDNGVISWTGDVASDLSFIFTAAVDADPTLYGAAIFNTASFTSASGDSDSSSAVVMVGVPDLGITKTVDLTNDPADPGDLITYTIVVYNAGPVSAMGVHITDELPVGLIGQSVDLTVTIGAMDAYTLVVTATVAADATPGATLTNTAYFDHVTGSDSASVAFVIRTGYEIYLPVVTKLHAP